MLRTDEELETAALQSDLQLSWAALEGFELVYQPQINLRSRRVTGFEVLLRWRHPIRGDVPPSLFIPLAEKAGLMTEIGHWVLDQACQEAAKWAPDIKVAVNVSSTQLQSATLPNVVAATLKKHGLAPSRLELEITETAELPSDPIRLRTLREIQSSGVRIAMDDFDVGFSCFTYLLFFPFNKIKLDSSLIHGIAESEFHYRTTREIVVCIVGLCEKLGIGLVAEGVETKEQLDLLMEVGCADVQGYLCGRPAPSTSVPGLLANSPDLLGWHNKGQLGLEPYKTSRETIPFFQIAETLNDIVIVTTPDLSPPGPEILYVNPAFTRLTGFSKAEAMGRTPRILQGPGTDSGTRHSIGVALRAGQPVHEKILNYAKSGAPYWLDLQIVALRDAAGNVTHFAAVERDVTMDKRRLDELEHLADRDTLTGIPNRRAFFRATESELESAAAAGPPNAPARGPCLAFIDVDHFKLVNDELGHAIGDAVLCGVAECLTENVRRSDILGRLGGEEFAVCMPAVTLEEATALAETLRQAIAGSRIATPMGPVSITASIGVACFETGDNIATLTKRADLAMYSAKQAGRNRVRTHPSQAEAAGHDRRSEQGWAPR